MGKRGRRREFERRVTAPLTDRELWLAVETLHRVVNGQPVVLVAPTAAEARVQFERAKRAVRRVTDGLEAGERSLPRAPVDGAG